MCIPPIDEGRHAFCLIEKPDGRFALPQLSMGMSGDFEEA